jgi:hypothetical protein
MARVLDTESLTRRHWQVLNTIALGARTPEEVDAALAPFGATVHQLADLRARGWVTGNGEPRRSLTEYPGRPARQVS